MGLRARAGVIDARFVVSFVVLAWSVAPAAASVRVHLVHGSMIEALEYRVAGGQATLIFPAGGTIAFPSSLVRRVEEIAPEPRIEPPRTEAALPPVASQQPRDTQNTAIAGPQPGAVIQPDGEQDGSIDSLIRSAARRHSLEPELLAAVIAVESGYRIDAVSPKGAQGLMQLMPGTAKDLAVTDPFDPRQNIDAGARYLRQLLDLHGDSFVDALAAYNAGAGRVARYKGLPPYRETIAYIGRVLRQYRTLQPAPPDAGTSR